MDVEIIGVDKDGLAHDVGEGIFGYGAPDGSLGRSAFTAPPVYANRRRQGVFWNPYSVKSYEAAEPEMRWALEQRPGLPRFPGSSAQGLVLVGPAMGCAPPRSGRLPGLRQLISELGGRTLLWALSGVYERDTDTLSFSCPAGQAGYRVTNCSA